jgi:hypothetical protein
MFNARPDLDALLGGLAKVNRGPSRAALFAEVRSETIRPAQARAFARAGFVELEVGVQSTHPPVLDAIGRPTALDAARRGIRALTQAGIRVTVDLMGGLPLQTPEALAADRSWVRELHGVNLQFMQTLLLPGAELRAQRRKWRLRADPRPPYRVRCTPALSGADLRFAEEAVAEMTGRAFDCPARRFVGVRLPDLFAEQVTVDLDAGAMPRRLPGRQNRRALRIKGRRIFGARDAVQGLVRRAMRSEPHMLWQFVLCPSGEEPLDLLDLLTDTIRAERPHVWDLQARTGDSRVLAARRLFVQLARRDDVSAGWRDAAEECLRQAFL